MKLRDDDKVWLRVTIADEVEKAAAKIADSLKPHGARKVFFLA